MEQFLIRFKKPLLICFGVLTFYALLGFVALPMILESKIPELAEQHTGKKANVSDVDFDPFGLKLSIKDFELTEPDGAPIIALKELYVNYGLWSSLRYWAAAVDKIFLDRPLINVVRYQDGSINLAKLSTSDEPEPEPEPESEETFPFWLGILRINDGEIDINDYSKEVSYQKQITDLNLDIEKIATIELDEHQGDTLSLAFADGGVISWDGDVQLAPELSSNGTIKVKDFNSNILWDYLKREMDYDIKQGKWNIETNYEFSLTEDQSRLKLTDGHLLLSEVLGQDSQLEWKGQADILPQVLTTGTVNVKGVKVKELAQFVPEDVGFKIEQGGLDLSSEYRFAMSDDDEAEMQLQLTNSQLQLSDLLDTGDSLSWQSEKTDVMPDIHSAGQVQVKGLNVHKIWLQMQEQFDLKIQSAFVDLDSQYIYQQAKTAEQPQLQLSDTAIDFHDVSLSAKDSDQALVKVNQLAVKQLALDLEKRSVNIESVVSDKGSILTIVDQNGEANLSYAFTGRTAKKALAHAEEAIPEATQNPWLVNVKSVAVQNYVLDFTQQMPGEPVKMMVSPINININNFSTAKNSEFQVKTDLTVNKTGKINTDGKVSLDPMFVKTSIKASKLALTPLQPFLDQSTRLQLISGQLGLDSKLNFKLDKSGAPKLNAGGTVSIAKLKTVEKNNKKSFLKWSKVDLKQFDFNLEPLSLKANSLNISGLKTEVIVNKDKSTNLGYLFSVPETQKAKEPKPETKTAEKKSNPMSLGIKAIKIKDSAGFFADRSLVLPFAANIKKLNGKVTNVSNSPTVRSKIYLQGEANETAPVLIQGDIEPFNFENHMNILMQFSNLSMTGMTPYMAEFAGYKIEKGKLSVNLLYKLDKSNLQAENQIVINQLTLGDQVESPNSVDVPINLALGLLKDRNGTIDLSLPLSGNLNDPEFSVWDVLGDVLLNTITKVVASPFNAMGSLLNTTADLSQVAFQPGSAAIQEEQKKTLDLLAQGLLQRPQLQLQVRGTAYRNEDSIGLAEHNIIRQIKTEVWNDMDRDERPAEIDDTPVPDEEFNELLTDLFEDKFDDDQSDQLVDQAEDAKDPETAKDYYRQMLKQLAESETVANHDLNELARQRAREISNYLVEEQQVPENRVFILGHTVLDQAQGNEIVVPLELGVND